MNLEIEAYEGELRELRKFLDDVKKSKTRIGEMEWHWGYERGWDAAWETIQKLQKN